MGVLRLGSSPEQRLTLVCQDWGGLLGLRLVAAAPHRFARVVTANTFLPTGMSAMPEAFKRWVQFSQTAEDLPVAAIVAGGCSLGLDDGAMAAYDAPYEVGAVPPGLDAKAGVRVLPALVPTSPQDPAFGDNRKAWAVLASFRRPWLCAFSDEDPITRGGDDVFRSLVPGTASPGVEHAFIRGAGHFLQEDAGAELGRAVAAFVEATAAACPARMDSEAALLGGREAAERRRRADARLYGTGARHARL